MTSLWGCPSVGLAARCCLTLLSSSLSSVASDFQGFLQRFDCVGSMFKLGQMLKAASSSGAAPSFKETHNFQAEQREREESGGPLFRWTDVRASTSALPMKGFL